MTQRRQTQPSMFYKAIQSEENFKQKNNLLKSTEKLNKAENIEKQRAAFNDVSR